MKTTKNFCQLTDNCYQLTAMILSEFTSQKTNTEIQKNIHKCFPIISKNLRSLWNIKINLSIAPRQQKTAFFFFFQNCYQNEFLWPLGNILKLCVEIWVCGTITQHMFDDYQRDPYQSIPPLAFFFLIHLQL